MAGKAVFYYDKLKVTGLSDVQKLMRAGGAATEDIREPMFQVSQLAKDVARAAAPKGRTGALSGSIKAKPTTRMARIEYGGGVKYAFLSELGGGARWRSRRGMSRRGPFPWGFRTRAKMYIFHKPNVSPEVGYHVLPAIRENATKLAERFIDVVWKKLEEVS